MDKLNRYTAPNLNVLIGMDIKFSAVFCIVIFGLAGCGGPKVEIKGENGETVKVDGKGGVEVKDKDGKMEMSKDAVKESELGLPFYPGSTSMNAQKSEADGKKQLLCIRQTKDDPKKVGEFYKGKFKVESNATSGTDDNQMVVMTGKLTDGRKVTLNVTQSKGEETTVSIVVGQE